MIKKGLVCAIVVLFIGMSVIPSTATNGVVKKSTILSNNGNTLYVGGSGPDNYTSIQSAINDANPGDTVFVYDDSSPYYEHLVIKNSINLIGENRDTTTIDGGGSGIVIDFRADNVNLSGFTITRGGYTKALLVYSDNNTINCNNFISNTWIAIYITGESNKITNNTIKNNYLFGIWIDSNGNSICNNTISKNEQGIVIRGSKNNTISGNNIVNSREEGIYMLSGSSKNIITENTITHNAPRSSAGIYLINSCDNVFSANDLSNNNRGFYLHTASNNIFSRNTITNNAIDGIHLWCSSGNSITDNNIANNFQGGVILRSSARNTINGNAITNNQGGIEIMFDTSHNNSIYHNDFIDNNQNALDYSDIENYFDDGYPSGGNYWDDYTGIDSDGDGIGDTPYPIPEGDNEDRYPLMDPRCGFPYAPIITGPTEGKPGEEYNYTFVTIDPNEDNVYYYINWGDGTYTDWIGPYQSGEEVTLSHTWSKKGKYTLQIRAKDYDDLLSSWGILTVTMPRNKVSYNLLLLRLLEQFPILQKILCYIL